MTQPLRVTDERSALCLLCLLACCRFWCLVYTVSSPTFPAARLPNKAHLQSKKIKVLIVSPTREFASQIYEEGQMLCRFHSGFKLMCIYCKSPARVPPPAPKLKPTRAPTHSDLTGVVVVEKWRGRKERRWVKCCWLPLH